MRRLYGANTFVATGFGVACAGPLGSPRQHEVPAKGYEAQQSRSAALFRTLEYPKLPILAARAGKTGYIQHATAVRKPGDTAAEVSGPGTALMELDEAAHRAIGVAAALVTTWYTTRQAAR
jgi:hypothetical protein